MFKSVVGPQRCIAALLLILLSGPGAGAIAQSAPSQPDPANLAKKDITAYRILFRRVATYQRMVDDATKDGLDKGYLFRSLQTRFGLGEPEMASLRLVALFCQKELAPLLAQKKAVIVEYQSQFPDRKIPQGMQAPPPPASIAQIEAQENAVILKYRQMFSNDLPLSTFHDADVLIPQAYANSNMSLPPSTTEGR